jgi:hypothetical protein
MKSSTTFVKVTQTDEASKTTFKASQTGTLQGFKTYLTTLAN